MEDQATGGLQLPPTVGPGFEIEGEVEASWDTFEDMELVLTQMGFPPVEQPNFNRPQLTPEILTSPDSKKYTEVYWQVEAWHNFAYNTMARIKAILIQVANEQNKIERIIRKDAATPNADGTKKPKQTKIQLDDLIGDTPRYEELTYEKQKLEQQVKILQSHVDSLDRDLKLVSRQVEIRRQDIDAGRRATNLPGHGNYGRGG